MTSPDPNEKVSSLTFSHKLTHEAFYHARLGNLNLCPRAMGDSRLPTHGSKPFHTPSPHIPVVADRGELSIRRYPIASDFDDVDCQRGISVLDVAEAACVGEERLDLLRLSGY